MVWRSVLALRESSDCWIEGPACLHFEDTASPRTAKPCHPGMLPPKKEFPLFGLFCAVVDCCSSGRLTRTGSEDGNRRHIGGLVLREIEYSIANNMLKVLIVDS